MSNPIYENLSLEERKEFTFFNRKIEKYVINLDAQRKTLKDMKVSKKDIESLLDHSFSPKNEEYFKQASLWWKAYGPIELYK